MTAQQSQAFQKLLASWRRREDVRSAGSVSDLVQARVALDAARAEMSATRFGFR